MAIGPRTPTLSTEDGGEGDRNRRMAIGPLTPTLSPEDGGEGERDERAAIGLAPSPACGRGLG
jgi:hypothetical protein